MRPLGGKMTHFEKCISVCRSRSTCIWTSIKASQKFLSYVYLRASSSKCPKLKSALSDESFCSSSRSSFSTLFLPSSRQLIYELNLSSISRWISSSSLQFPKNSTPWKICPSLLHNSYILSSSPIQITLMYSYYDENL